MTYDFIPSWHEPGNCMDRRHIACVYELLMLMKPARTLEIGGYSGCSSSAFVAAGILDAHFSEIAPRADFLSVVSGFGYVHHRKGCEVLREMDPFDVVLVDGSHDLVSVTEELEQLLAKPPKVIIAHDVNSTNVGFPLCEGAAHLWNEIQRLGWRGRVDVKAREGERTDRGLMMATLDPALIRYIDDAFSKTCGLS